MAMNRLLKAGLSKSEAKMVVAAYGKGKLSKAQYEKLAPKMLLGMVKKMK